MVWEDQTLLLSSSLSQSAVANCVQIWGRKGSVFLIDFVYNSVPWVACDLNLVLPVMCSQPASQPALLLKQWLYPSRSSLGHLHCSSTKPNQRCLSFTLLSWFRSKALLYIPSACPSQLLLTVPCSRTRPGRPCR